MSIEDSLINSFSNSELTELHQYAVRKGVFSAAGTDGQNAAVDALELQRKALSDDATPKDRHDYYIALCNITHPVNGKTLSDSRSIFKLLRTWPFFIFGLLILGGALSNQIILGICLENDDIFSAYQRWCIVIQPYILEVLEPFFWGGLGSFIYLLQRMFSLAAKCAFNIDRFTGWFPRMLLGAILGGIFQYILDPSFLEETGYDTVSIAFFVGLAAKPIYDIFEDSAYAFSEGVRERIRPSRSNTDNQDG